LADVSALLQRRVQSQARPLLQVQVVALVGVLLERLEDDLRLDLAVRVRDEDAGDKAIQHIRGLPVLPRSLADNLRVPEPTRIPLHGATHRPGENALSLSEELLAEPVIPLLRLEVALPRNELHAPPEALILASELRLEVRRQHQEEYGSELEELLPHEPRRNEVP